MSLLLGIKPIIDHRSVEAEMRWKGGEPVDQVFLDTPFWREWMRRGADFSVLETARRHDLLNHFVGRNLSKQLEMMDSNIPD